MPKDRWIVAAMTDDMMVVELLVRLKQQSHATPPESSSPSSPASADVVLPLRSWGVRQPRSKQVFRCASVLARKDQLDQTRGSPTTPLSWSADTASPSATADGGFEESSLLDFRSSTARSKGLGANETYSGIPGKRSRRKKTFTELKDEESLLLKERIFLRKEIAAARATVKDKKAANKRLKKMKHDLNLQSAKERSSKSAKLEEAQPGRPYQTGYSHIADMSSALPPQTCLENYPPFDSSKVPMDGEPEDSFLLPDLNMLPSEEDFGVVGAMS